VSGALLNFARLGMEAFLVLAEAGEHQVDLWREAWCLSRLFMLQPLLLAFLFMTNFLLIK